MLRPLFTVLTAVLALPSIASAATVTADVERRQGAPFGPVTFQAERGEVNDLVVTAGDGQLRFRDLANRVTARGDCEQVDAQTALCPFTEDIADVKLGNRGDSATVEGLVRVLGGSGFDRLRGSGGNDILDGQGGADVLRGIGDSDELTGGRGEDVLFGGGGDDDLIDGELTRRAATDIYRGGGQRDSAGPSRGDMIFYTKRNSGLTVDLSARQVSAGSEGDDLSGVESVTGGDGKDQLTGDGGENMLDGGRGDDDLSGRGGGDILTGGGGDDNLDGGDGGDVIDGGGKTDTFEGGGGGDTVNSRDRNAETVVCGQGDDTVLPTRDDTVDLCEVARLGVFGIEVQPSINGNNATFRVACQQLGGCDGDIALTGPNGENFGGGSFTGLPDDPQTFTEVAVTLTPVAVDAIDQGVTVTVSLGSRGYRALMRSS